MLACRYFQNLSCSSLFVLISIFCLFSCGRYSPPIPPEFSAPNKVIDLQVKPTADSLNFSWEAPEKDARGEVLKDLVGYNIYKSTLDKGEKLILKNLKFELMATVADKYLNALQLKQAEARASGMPVRKVKVDEDLRSHYFTDRELAISQIYVYKLTPYSSVIESSLYDIVRVNFNGLASVIDSDTALSVSREEGLSVEEEDLDS